MVIDLLNATFPVPVTKEWVLARVVNDVPTDGGRVGVLVPLNKVLDCLESFKAIQDYYPIWIEWWDKKIVIPGWNIYITWP